MELLTMFWEDYYLNNPIDARKNDKNEVQYVTGDPLIDKWEEEIAKGLSPDLTEGLPPEARAKEREAVIRSERKQIIQSKAEKELGLGFTESYGG
jgi:hypothetical protein